MVARGLLGVPGLEVRVKDVLVGFHHAIIADCFVFGRGSTTSTIESGLPKSKPTGKVEVSKPPTDKFTVEG